MPDQPAARGLYDPRFEHDACGVSFVVDVKGRVSHRIIELGLSALCNLEHRGASGAEVNTGDGAGITVQVPDAFLRATAGFRLPPAGSYAVGLAFLPVDDEARTKVEAAVEAIVADEGLRVLGWRDVPVVPDEVGPSALAVMPVFRQLFVDDPLGSTGLVLERRVYCARKRVERDVTNGDGERLVYFASLS